MMKLLWVYLIFTVFQFSLFSQSEVKQDVNGAIFYIYDLNEDRDSIKLINSRTSKLSTYEIDGNDVVIVTQGTYSISWKKYKINKADRTSMQLYKKVIGKVDKELRGNLLVEINDINGILVSNKRTKDVLISIEYNPEEGTSTIHNRYDGTTYIEPFHRSPRVLQDKNSRVISRQ